MAEKIIIASGKGGSGKTSLCSGLALALKNNGNYVLVVDCDIAQGCIDFMLNEERKALLEAIRYVDEVIPEEKWEQKVDDIKKYNIDILTMGSDWEGDNKFERLKEYCEVRYTTRPYTWSSTEFRKSIDKYVSNIEE